MRHLPRILSLALTFGILTAVSAMAAEKGTITPRIQQGDWELGGGFNLSHTSRNSAYSPGTRSTFFYLSGAGQYFVSDGLSIGLDAALASSGSRSTGVRAGPAITKYLFVQDRLAPYVSMLPIQWSKAEGTRSTFASSARVGAKYFLTDSVAVGPAVEYEHQWGGGAVPEANEFSFLGLFSIHL